MYDVVICYNCGQLLLVRKGQKTRQCPHCETRVNTGRAKAVASATSAREASELIRALKGRRKS
jgi:ribosomal protein L37AE/L43A